jgi:hypothetical protein
MNGTQALFISRAGADAPFAAQIGRILAASGCEVILQEWNFANRSFMEPIHAALADGARVVGLLSPDYQIVTRGISISVPAESRSINDIAIWCAGRTIRLDLRARLRFSQDCPVAPLERARSSLGGLPTASDAEPHRRTASRGKLRASGVYPSESRKRSTMLQLSTREARKSRYGAIRAFSRRFRPEATATVSHEKVVTGFL